MKVWKGLFNFITITLLGYTALASVYSVLPPEYQLEQFTTLTALISGASAGGIGTALLYIKSLLIKNEKATDEKQNETLNKFLVVTTAYDRLEKKIAEMEAKAEARYQEQTKREERTHQLLEADLRAKLSNRFISEETRALIEGVLNEKEMV